MKTMPKRIMQFIVAQNTCERFVGSGQTRTRTLIKGYAELGLRHVGDDRFIEIFHRLDEV
jgi:hypothetical protein